MEQRACDKLICVAAVAGAHGVRGAMRLRCFTEDPSSVAEYGPVFDETGRELFRLRPEGPWKAGIIARADGVTTRDQAEALKGTELFVPRSRLPETDEDEFYFEDLIGLSAMAQGSLIGRVRQVEDHGASAVIGIEVPDGGLVELPFTLQCVPHIDLKKGVIEIELPEEVSP